MTKPLPLHLEHLCGTIPAAIPLIILSNSLQVGANLSYSVEAARASSWRRLRLHRPIEELSGHVVVFQEAFAPDVLYLFQNIADCSITLFLLNLLNIRTNPKVSLPTNSGKFAFNLLPPGSNLPQLHDHSNPVLDFLIAESAAFELLHSVSVDLTYEFCLFHTFTCNFFVRGVVEQWGEFQRFLPNDICKDRNLGSEELDRVL
jgi:hypothetical protein